MGTIFWIILCTILIFLLGLAGITWWFRKQVLSALRDVSTLLRKLERDSKNLGSLITKEYAEDNPKPVTEQVGVLKLRIELIIQQLQDAYRLYGKLHQNINGIFPRNKYRVITAPYDWFHMMRKVERFEQNCDQTLLSYNEIEQQMQEIQGIAWTLAQQYRELYTIYRNASYEVEKLINQGVSGLDEMIEKMYQLENRVREIPEIYKSGGKEEVLRQSDRSSIIQVFNFLEENDRAIHKTVDQVNKWRDDFQNTQAHVETAQNSLMAIEGLIPQIPDDLDITSNEETYERFTNEAKKLKRSLEHPPVNSLSKISKQSYRMMRILKDSENQLKNAATNLETYANLREKLLSAINSFPDELEKLEHNLLHPIVFSESKSELARIRENFDKFDLPSDVPKTLNQIVTSIHGWESLQEQVSNYGEHIDSVKKQYNEFMLLLKSIDVPQALLWVQESETLAERVKEFDPGNWSKKDDLRILPDLSVLKESLEKNLPGEAGVPIQEDDLPRLYRESFNTSELYQELKDQVSRVKDQYNQLLGQGREHQEDLDICLKALNNLSLLAEKNVILDDIIAADIDPLRNQVEKEQMSLNQTHKGILAKKVKKAQSITENVRQHCENWLIELSKEIDRMKDLLSGMVRDVEKIAHLDDAIMQETSGILSKEPEWVGRQNIAGMDLETLMEGYIKLNSEWQRYTIAYPKLEQVVKPVIDGYAEMKNNREIATSSINTVGTNMDIRRTTNFQRLEREFIDLEREIERIKSNRFRALYLASRLKEYSNQYQDITERIKHFSTRVADHQEKVRALSGELQSLVDVWQVRLNEYYDNPVAKKDIEQLISEVQASFNQIQTTYQQSGELSQQQVNLLNANILKLREKVAPIGNSQWVDMNGVVSGLD